MGARWEVEAEEGFVWGRYIQAGGRDDIAVPAAAPAADDDAGNVRSAGSLDVDGNDGQISISTLANAGQVRPKSTTAATSVSTPSRGQWAQSTEHLAPPVQQVTTRRFHQRPPNPDAKPFPLAAEDFFFLLPPSFRARSRQGPRSRRSRRLLLPDPPAHRNRRHGLRSILAILATDERRRHLVRMGITVDMRLSTQLSKFTGQ